MNDTIKITDKMSLSAGKYWFPEESVETKNTANENKKEHYGLPDLSKAITQWRNEREEILKNKQIQKRKLFLKRLKNLDKNKISDEEKFDLRKKMENALRNTLKKRDNYDLLLAELEFFENEGQNLHDSSQYLFHNVKIGSRDLTVNTSDTEKGENDSLTLKQIFSNQSTMKFLAEGEAEKFPDRSSKCFVYKNLIEEVFLRLKKQQEHESFSSLNISPYDDNYFKDSYEILKNLYEKEMKTLNLKGSDDSHVVQYTFQTFPPFPSSIKELDVLFNNPLIVFREWCHFYKLNPMPLQKINRESLVNEITSSSADVHIRLTSLCTLMHLYNEFYSISAGSPESAEIHLTGHDLQKTSSRKSSELGKILHNTLMNSYGKVKLGTALAIALTDRSNENRDIISSTLMTAVKGISTIEKRIASMAMAYAGIFDHTALHVLLEEWKTAQYAHTLQQYLTALRWLSIHENSIIRSVAEYLTSRNLNFRLYVCLTLPFLEGNLPVGIKDTLIHIMRNSSAHILRLAAARVLEWKERGDCVQEHILVSMNSPNVLRALEVIQLSLMLRHIDPKITKILLPCLNSDSKYVKIIALNVIEKLHISTPSFVEAVSKVVLDKDSEVREAALNALCLCDVSGTEVESLAFTVLLNERNEDVYTAVLKLIKATQMKGKTLRKLLRNSLKKPHRKVNQQLISSILESIDLEVDDVSSNKSLSVSKSLDRDSVKSGDLKTVSYFSLENATNLQSALHLLDNTTIPQLSTAKGHMYNTEDDKKSDRSRGTILSESKGKLQFKKNIH